MRRHCIFGLLASLFCAGSPAISIAQDADPLQITWEVKNRFRLFRSEADFELHVAAHADGGSA